MAWDGVGLGADRTLWGGEFLHVTPLGCQRVAWLRPFPLPGGDAAARDGRRVLAGLCVEAGLPLPGHDGPGRDGRGGNIELARFAQVARSPRLSPLTSSAGRLFDAVAALTGLCPRSRFEGQAAMAVEHAARPGARPYSFVLDGGEAGVVIDWRPMLAEMINEIHGPGRAADAGLVASRFHATLVDMIARVVEARGARVVALSGGCFQNRLLATETHAALAARGVRVLLPARVPPGDGGLALGQAWVASHHLSGRGPIGQR